MTEAELRKLIQEIRTLPSETECVEFKEAKTNYDFGKLGKYFSALSNESNLKSKNESWLIFGIQDKPIPRQIIGSHFRSNRSDLDSLKAEIANKTSNRLTFHEIYELTYPEGRVVLFHIPAAPKGLPVAWEGHYYGRDGEDIGPLNLVEIEKIRNQATKSDWSEKIIPEATISDLEPDAIKLARNKYKIKFRKLADEVDKWDDVTFLNKAKITIGGKITNTAIILLGKPESDHFISPSVAKISWILKDSKNIELDYEHFEPPFIINVDQVLAKIRNLKYRYLLKGTLFPEEVTMYDEYVIREALHNCIAHQDYNLGYRVSVVEFPKKVIFSNGGNFTPDDVIKVLHRNAPESDYKNQFLVNAMFNLDMIDTIGSGIKRMFQTQADRLFPLPEYTIDKLQISLYIYGEILKMEYAQYLSDHKDLTLDEIIILDKFQKGKVLSEKEVEYLTSIGFSIRERLSNQESAQEQVNQAQDEAHDQVQDEAHDQVHEYLSETQVEILKFTNKFINVSSEDIRNLFSHSSISGNLKKAISNLIELGYLKFTIPDKPKSKYQKYTITEKGVNLIR